MVVVARTLVTDATSKSVLGPGCGEAESKVKRPKARAATSLPACVTAMEAAGKARTEMASSSTRKAPAKRAF